MKTSKSSSIFILILIAYLAYAGFFIYRTSFLMDGERYFALFDDAMVSMRYAKNLANGYGLVWNPGAERVEGYTNPMWVFYMAFFHLFSIAPSKISLFIQISGALILMLNLFFVKKLADSISNGSSWVSSGAVFLTAFYYPLINWSLQGMEVSVLTLIVTVCALIALNSLRTNTFSIWLYILLGVSTLVRIDMAILLFGTLAFMAIADRKNRNKHLLQGSALSALVILAQTLSRAWYYGELLPNTYYLKMTGYPVFLRIAHGIAVTSNFIRDASPLVFLLPFTTLIFRRDRPILLLLWLFLSQMIYNVYVGGDAWEDWGGSNRYVSVVMPLFFVLLSCGTWRITLFLESYFTDKAQTSKRAITILVKFGFLAILFACFVNLNLLYSAKGFKKWLTIIEPIHAIDNQWMVGTAKMVKMITTEKAKIAVVWAGSIPYFSERYAIDFLGKNDKKIAREPIKLDASGELPQFYPGHLKWDYGYSIGQLKPDVITQLWKPESGEAEPYLEDGYAGVPWHGFRVYLLRDSPHIKWDELKNIYKIGTKTKG